MKKIIAAIGVLLMLVSLSLPALAADNVINDESKQQLYNWMIEEMDWSGSFEDFEPVDITGDDSADTYRIYHLLKGNATVMDYLRVGNRVLGFGTASNILAAAKTENGVITEICTIQDAFSRGVIDDTAVDRIADGHGIWVCMCGDVNDSGTVDTADIVSIKSRILSGLCSVEDGSDDLIYDVDQNDVINVADMLALKNIIMGT